MLNFYLNIFKLLILLNPILVYSQVFNQSDRITSDLKNQLIKNTNGRYFSDNFGTAISMNDSFAAVSSIEEDEDSLGNFVQNSGAVYILKKRGNNWILWQKLVANDRRPNDKFGSNVALNGDYLLVSSENNSYDTINNNFVSKSGSVYIFKKNQGRFNFFQKITANSRETNLFFGSSIAISGDNIIVGTPLDNKDTSGANSLTGAGAVYFFKLTNGKWIQKSKIVAFDRETSDYYGASVFVKDTFIFVGAPNEDHDTLGANLINNGGSVYIYTIRGNKVYFFQKIIANNRSTNGQFGYRIVADSNNLIINAKLNNSSGNLYAFTFYSNRWNFSQRIFPNDLVANDEFGNRIDIDNNVLISTSYLQDKDTLNQNSVLNAGAAYIFQKVNGTWNQIKKIVPNSRNSQSQFGFSCGTNGIDFLIGSNLDDLDSNEKNFVPNAGSIYHFKKTISRYPQISKINASDYASYDNFGYSVAFWGNYAVTGSKYEDENTKNDSSLYNSGAAYIIQKINGQWYRKQKITPKFRYENDGFGTSVSINDNFAVIGTPNHKLDTNENNSLTDAGAVFIFKKNQNLWIQSQKIIAPDRAANTLFGQKVYIYKNYLLISAPNESKDSVGTNNVSYSGAIYLYELNNNKWIFKQKITHNDRNINDQLGYSIDMNDNTIIAGSWSNSRDSIGQNVKNGSGAVYIFKKNNNRWVQSQKIVASDRQTNDYFGQSCAIDKASKHIIVGAYFKHININSPQFEGASYIFKESNNQFLQIGKLLSNDSIKNNLLFGSNVDIHDSLFMISSEKNISVYKIGYLKNINFIQKINGKDPNNNLYSGVIQFNGKTLMVGAVNDPYDSSGQQYLVGNGTVYFFNDTSCNLSSFANLNITACNFYQNSKNNIWNKTGEYFDTFVNYRGCDSILTTNLTINNSTYDSLNITACNNYYSPSKKYIFSESGIFIDTIPNYVSCDSIIKINLKILKPSFDSINVSACNNYLSPSKKYTYSQSGLFSDTIQNYNGCDSIIKVNLIILNPSFDSINVSACNNYLSPSKKYTYTNTGIYNDTLKNYMGCDSILKIKLIVNKIVSNISIINDTLKAYPKNSIYQWFSCDTFLKKIPNETNDYYIPKNNGKFAVVVNYNNCKDTSDCIDFNSLSINNKSPFYFKIIPNPASENISVIYSPNQIINKAIIYNIEGQVTKFITSNYDKIDINFLNNGIYFIVIYAENRVFYTKFVILK